MAQGRQKDREPCRADGGAPCATSARAGLPVDTTNVNISVCGGKVMEEGGAPL